MALFAISDLHLSFGVDKPMDIFSGWQDYTTRIYENWQSRVKEDDTVVIAGDISWAMNFKELKEDFCFINKLNGKKIILKGNHDYWWTTVKKMQSFIEENSFHSIEILHNNAFETQDYAICGTRGWLIEKPTDSELDKVYVRECQRLEASIKEGLKIQKELMVFLHYPPIYENQVSFKIIEILKNYNIKKCFYGHLHGASTYHAMNGNAFGIEFRLISCDYVNFSPILIEKL
jgi:predicted phosphohydrolase